MDRSLTRIASRRLRRRIVWRRRHHDAQSTKPAADPLYWRSVGGLGTQLLSKSNSLAEPTRERPSSICREIIPCMTGNKRAA